MTKGVYSNGYMDKHIAVYMRVSSKSQDVASQEADLKRWVAAQDKPSEWYVDKFTGTSMDRPAFNRLEHQMHTGGVSAIVVWRLDRLGRTARGLHELFEDLIARKVNLVSLREGLDLSTPAGRLLAGVLASVAQYETEVRSERQQAGIQAAIAAGKRWGRLPGTKCSRVPPEKRKAVLEHKEAGWKITDIARAVGMARKTVYAVLREDA